ncbi:hypothetical protein V5P93_002253 [Actinokineospora auranticolor]|uniref:Type VII secretion system (Wss) protein ESAT-6 n=1 Tax=Actinokineospora auranticolor TaxID=155976 RepID=A0A2S6GB36_9PSEU|nr:hypothetical protein [Actinokineospora auranticolor]PPK60746.1 hypothetical protein CLV40_1484 [Actinokineospora auranticolor]
MTSPKKSIAETLNVTEYDESLAANADRAAEKTPVVGNVWKAGKSIAEHAQQLTSADDLGDLAAASGQLAADGAKFVSGAAVDVTFFAMDPIGWLVSHGLDMLLELVQPLQDALHQVSGDGPAIGHAAENFVEIAQGFSALSEDFIVTGDSALADWQDEAGDAARAALADFATGISGVGSTAGSVAEVLRMWSMVMVVIEEVIKAIISELVSWLITIWLPALASSVITLGGSVAAAMTASIAKAASVFAKVTKHLGVFGRLLDDFMKFLQKYAGKIEKVAEKFRVGKLVEKGQRGTPVVGKVAEHDVFIPSRRVLTTAFGAASGVAPLVTGVGIKSGIGAAKSVGKETYEELRSDGPAFNESGIGGDHDVEETRRNLEM